MKIRKVIRIADCRAITLPRSFPDAKYVTVKLDGERLIISPLKEVG